MSERIQKVLAHQGWGSRRQIETWIKQGKIKINGRFAQLGETVGTTDVIQMGRKYLDLNKVNTKTGIETSRLIMYHKKEGELVTRFDHDNRPIVFKNLPKIQRGRWIAIGRLDFNTSGLLLFTNNGELANRWMHPKQQLEREYAVRVLGSVTPDIIKNLTKGVMLDDSLAKFEQLIDAGGSGANHWYHVMVKEGRNRLVRRLWESQQLSVSRLIRIRFGEIRLPPSLTQGRWQEVDLKSLKQTML